MDHDQTPTPTPRELFSRAQSLRADAIAVEGAAIRAALVACHWRVAPAAALLGLPRHTSLVRALARHPEIVASLDAVRDEVGGVRRGAAHVTQVRKTLCTRESRAAQGDTGALDGTQARKTVRTRGERSA